MAGIVEHPAVNAYAIRVSSPEGKTLFSKRFADREQFLATTQNWESRGLAGHLDSLLLTTRTDSWEHFRDDFFLPGFVNTALKCDELIPKIILAICLIPLDLLTLAVRLVTLLPRYIYNSGYLKESHPLYQYLIQGGVSPKTLEDAHVVLSTLDVEHSGNNDTLIWKSTDFFLIESPFPGTQSSTALSSVKTQEAAERWVAGFLS